MPNLTGFGKILVLFGLVLVFTGVLFMLSGKVSWIGRLPGDIYIKKENFSFFFPITTSIVVSIALSLILFFMRKF